MLTIKETQLLNRVGPATIMGTYLRQSWLPVIESAELAPGEQPTQVRLLGEELVVYREPGGQVGLLGAWCAHASAPMAQAANEEDGLFCGLHGWKFDRNGRCIYGGGVYWEEMFNRSFRLPAYPCIESEGIVFAFMGARSGEPVPELAEPTWLTGGARRASLSVHHVRWYRAIEAEIRAAMTEGTSLEFQMPCALIRRAATGGIAAAHLWVPIDDEHSLAWVVQLGTEPSLASQVTEPQYLPERRGWFYPRRWAVPPADPVIESRPIPATPAPDAELPETPADVAVLDALQQLIHASREFREHGVAAGR
ncbi:MAG: phthalate 4,5-dioxygenase [Chloroflexota bacterium]|nr:phthalate 4,5-dioxygenase [Chloroflexota bacterium]